MNWSSLGYKAGIGAAVGALGAALLGRDVTRWAVLGAGAGTAYYAYREYKAGNQILPGLSPASTANGTAGCGCGCS